MDEGVTIDLDSEYNAAEASEGQNAVLLTYPEGRGGVSIGVDDYLRLADGGFLNDKIVEFYLKWVERNSIPPAWAERVLCLDPFFYESLARVPYDHARVRRHLLKRNLFAKTVVVLPINAAEHWFAAVVKHSLDSAGNLQDCVILVLDSLGPNKQRNALVAQNIRRMLSHEHRFMFPSLPTTTTYDVNNAPLLDLAVPRQPDGFNCGIYMLLTVERFLQNQSGFRASERLEWDERASYLRGRARIARIIRTLSRAAGRHQEFPPLRFAPQTMDERPVARRRRKHYRVLCTYVIIFAAFLTVIYICQ